MNMATLKAGTVLYHGTDCDDFEEEFEGLNGPAWLSSSFDVASYFASRQGGWGGAKRIITYRLTEDVTLYEITSERAKLALADEFDLDFSGVEGMRDSVEQAGIPGWVVPGNFEQGDDILLVDTSVLDFIQTVPFVRKAA
ncbi:hypothetical protein G3A43_06505 [Paraburkholderia aspalathi]|nr:hypothetical protein [Paraburkholderia aspalathi]MBK3779900.1 hypothetical protein [Paraburkholderia aspalathi]